MKTKHNFTQHCSHTPFRLTVPVILSFQGITVPISIFFLDSFHPSDHMLVLHRSITPPELLSVTVLLFWKLFPCLLCFCVPSCKIRRPVRLGLQVTCFVLQDTQALMADHSGFLKHTKHGRTTLLHPMSSLPQSTVYYSLVFPSFHRFHAGNNKNRFLPTQKKTNTNRYFKSQF